MFLGENHIVLNGLAVTIKKLGEIGRVMIFKVVVLVQSDNANLNIIIELLKRVNKWKNTTFADEKLTILINKYLEFINWYFYNVN